ncbi:hypothetical protein GGS20DRAFT_547834 [Poronia punctata]|nr:hypothetical protein GGS20DRAFT_547834 [Poronia punctata]
MAALRHLRLPSYPNRPVPQFPSYAYASLVQTTLQQELQAWKAQSASSRGPPPAPTVISFTPAPTYTLGRRQTDPLTYDEHERLKSPLLLVAPRDERQKAKAKAGAYYRPAITSAPRGGLTTYHGPGQLVLWPVIDLHSPLHAHLSVRDYACLLEKTTIATLARLWGLKGFTTDNPGVWVSSRQSKTTTTTITSGKKPEERKIAALGVHLRRHVTGLGVAINYSTPVSGPPETNPWARIVPCGLGDRGVTSVCAELGLVEGEEAAVKDDLAAMWCSEFRKRLNFRPDAAQMLGKNTLDLDFLCSLGTGDEQMLVKASLID